MSYIKTGAILVGSGGIVWQISGKLLVYGLMVFWGLYGMPASASGTTDLGVDAIVQYSDLDLSSLGLDVTIPTPDRITNIIVKWTIYDKSGTEVNSDSFRIDEIKKDTPTFINKETTFKTDINELTDVVVLLEVSGKVGPFTISKEEQFDKNLVSLIDADILF